jgi:hypothetical protein
VYLATLIFGLAGFALFKDQFELVRLILASGLAVGAGAGLKSFFGDKPKDNK